MANAARKMQRRAAKSGLLGVIENGPEEVIVAPTARAAAVRKMREVASRIETGDLRGGRVEWRDGLEHIVTVELSATKVVLRRFRWVQG